MIAEHLTDLIAALRLQESRPIAIWIIDRPATYYTLLRIRDPQGDYMVTFADRELTFYGIPIRVGKSVRMKNYKNFFHCLPGVWVEMSDGNHLRLEDDFT